MNLREIVEVVGLPIVDLSRQSGVSRFRLYSFLHGDVTLKEPEQRAILDVLLQHGARVEQAIGILREVASA
jgi:hypothetical protein